MPTLKEVEAELARRQADLANVDAELARRKSAAVQPQTSTIGDVARGFGDVAAFGFADELEAGARSLVGPETYKQEIETARAKHEAAGPGYYAGMAGGMFVPGLGAAGLIGRGATGAAKLGRAAFAGAAEGGVAGLGAGEGTPTERLPSAAVGAAAGTVMAPIGQAVAGGLGKFAQRHLARDINRFDPAKTAALQQQAKAQGIQLTPAEATDLPSLKAQQKAVGNLPQSSDELATFYQGRAETQIEPAVNRFLENVSPVEGAEVAGLQGRAAAQRAMDDVAANRAKQARPIYQRAFATSGPVDTDSTLKYISQQQASFPKSGEVYKKLNKVMNLLTRQADDGTISAETALPLLHSSKLELDQMIDATALGKKLGRTTKAKLLGVRQNLKTAMETASPDYAAATNIYADLSPGVERVREGIVGVIADLKDPNVRLAASKLFNPATSGPVMMREAKRQIQTADPQAWQALKRAWLEENWLKSGKETMAGGPKVNRGALFRKAMLGDLKQRRMLEEALEPAEFKALSDLSSVLEASGRVKSVGSDTAWNQELMRTERQASSSLLSRVLKLSTPNVLKQIAEQWDERILAKRSQDVVRIITSPDGIEMLRELKRLPVRDVFKRSVIAQSIAALGISAGTQDIGP